MLNIDSSRKRVLQKLSPEEISDIQTNISFIVKVMSSDPVLDLCDQLKEETRTFDDETTLNEHYDYADYLLG